MHKLDRHPARSPRREPLEGETVVLEPLNLSRNGEQLFASAAGADSTWLYLPYGPFPSKQEFMSWLAERAALNDPLAFTIVDLPACEGRGIATFMSIVPEHGVIEIGHIWLSPRLQRTRQATEAIFVMA